MLDYYSLSAYLRGEVHKFGLGFFVLLSSVSAVRHDGNKGESFEEV